MQVTSSDEALLVVLPPVTVEQEQTVNFPIELNNLEILADKTSISVELFVVCTKTGQKQTVAVSVKLIGQTPDEYKSGECKSAVQFSSIFQISCENQE